MCLSAFVDELHVMFKLPCEASAGPQRCSPILALQCLLKGTRPGHRSRASARHNTPQFSAESSCGMQARAAHMSTMHATGAQRLGCAGAIRRSRFSAYFLAALCSEAYGYRNTKSRMQCMSAPLA